MSQKIKIRLAATSLILVLMLPTLASAQAIGTLLNKTADGAGYVKSPTLAQTGMATILGTVARVFISFVGVIFISYLIYGGWLWMSAAGNEEKVTKAKKTISDSVIGLVVALAAAGIYLLIKTALIATSSSGLLSS